MNEPAELCRCGHSMHVKRLTTLGVFAYCPHCDGPCYLGGLCLLCSVAQRAAAE